MQQTQRPNDPGTVETQELEMARCIPPLEHREAFVMASAELERFLTLVGSLERDDWEKLTACPLWNVRQILAHVTGAAPSYARWADFKRQINPKVKRPYRASGLSFLDSMKQIQVDDRASSTPEELIEELRIVGPRAIATGNSLTRLEVGLLHMSLQASLGGTGASEKMSDVQPTSRWMCLTFTS